MVSAKGILATIANIPRDMVETLRMSPLQALVWFSCWTCWTLGSMQYYALPFTTANMAKSLGVSQANIQEANTTSMLSRSIGAIIFGIASDQYGRKWPMMIDLLLLAVFTLSTGFVQTYAQLIGVRFLFGQCRGRF